MNRWYTKRDYAKFRRQRPIKGGRQHGTYGVVSQIDDALRRLAVKYHCTVPMIVTTIFADSLDIDLQPEDRFDWKPEHVKKSNVA